MDATYEVLAIRYAHLDRTARFNFLGGDEHDGPMPLDYYVWAIVSSERTVIVDTGFDHDVAQRRGRQIVRPVAEGLKAVGIEPDKVEHIVISHMHYDHSGNHDLFPRASYHLQEAELGWCTGRDMANSEVGGIFEADSVSAMTLSAQLPGPEGDAFVKKWQAAYNELPPWSLAAQLYDEVNMWAAAVKTAGSASDHAAVVKALKEMSYKGLTGTLKFDDRFKIPTNDASQPAFLFQVHDKALKPLMIGTRKTDDFIMPDWAK